MIKRDQIFQHLCAICDAFEEAKVPYRVAEGTLLGGVREKDIIAHEERDFELDVSFEDVSRVLALNKGLKKSRYEIVDREPGRFKYDVGYHFQNMKAQRDPVGGAGLIVMHDGIVVGDISVYTVFNDGMARRYCLRTESSPSPRMTIPAWYLEGDEKIEIRGRKFPCPRLPDAVVRKIYGEFWHEARQPGTFPKGFHPRSGQEYDAPIEPLMILALKNGWDGDYSDCPMWPRDIKYVGSHVGRKWLIHHDASLGLLDDEFFDPAERALLLRSLSDQPTLQNRTSVVSLIAVRGSLRNQQNKAVGAEKLIADERKKWEQEKKEIAAYIEEFQAELDELRYHESLFRNRRAVKAAVALADRLRKIRNIVVGVGKKARA